MAALLQSQTTTAEAATAPLIVFVAFLALLAVIVTGPLGKALAGRLGWRTRTFEVENAELARAELEAVQREVVRLAQQLAEVTERQAAVVRRLAEAKGKTAPTATSLEAG